MKNFKKFKIKKSLPLSNANYIDPKYEIKPNLNDQFKRLTTLKKSLKNSSFLIKKNRGKSSTDSNYALKGSHNYRKNNQEEIYNEIFAEDQALVCKYDSTKENALDEIFKKKILKNNFSKLELCHKINLILSEEKNSFKNEDCHYSYQELYDLLKKRNIETDSYFLYLKETTNWHSINEEISNYYDSLPFLNYRKNFEIILKYFIKFFI